MNGCKQFADIIGAYVFGQALKQECVDFERHMATCVTCRQDIEQRRAVLAAITPETPTATEAGRMLRLVRNRIVLEDAELKARKTRFVFRFVAAVCVACILFASGIMLGHRTAESRTLVKIVTRTVSQLDTPPRATSNTYTTLPLHQVERHVVPIQQPVVKVIHHYRYRVIAQRPPKVEQEKPTTSIEPVQTVAKVIAPMPLGVDDTRLAIVGN
jgi:hypothetical protein